MDSKQALTRLEEALRKKFPDFKLSQQQKDILTSGFKTPALINACAGAGKTTTMIMAMLYMALVNNIDPASVLAVTFSKRAQQDMEAKYNDMAGNFPELLLTGKPVMRTFHSLFYQILRKLTNKHFTVVTPNNYSRELFKCIKNPIDALSNSENIARFTDMASMLINKGASTNGLDVNPNNNTNGLLGVRDLPSLLRLNGQGDAGYINDYKRVIQNYQALKARDNAIDFDDMQTLLLNHIVTNDRELTIARGVVKKFDYCFLDEFQDINALQWKLINLLLSPVALKHLTAIGDDDQAIYSFRGSDTHYILNFTHLTKNAKTFNLSTNYRTHQNILNLAKPLVEANTRRLSKKLKAHNPGGSVTADARLDMMHDPALASFAKDVLNNPTKHYAVLARTNLNLSLIGDVLATRGITANMGKQSDILQYTRIYTIIMKTMSAIYHNDFNGYLQCARWLGFSKYRRFLLKAQHLLQPSSLDDYLSRIDQDKYRDDRIKWNQDDHIYRSGDVMTTEHQIQNMRWTIKTNKLDALEAAKVPKELFNLVINITSTYFDYVTKHRYVSYSNYDYKQLAAYVQARINQAKSMDEFLSHEQSKASSLLSALQKRTSVQCMTMHASKGLEFDETLIYLSDGDIITDGMLQLVKLFPAKDHKNDLLRVIDADPSRQTFAMLLSAGVTAILDIATGLSPKDKAKIKELAENSRMLTVADIDAALLRFTLNLNWGILARDKHLQNLVYYEAKASDKAVEEERRLFYVAITRARHKVIFDKGDNDSPLLKDLPMANTEGGEADD